MEGEEGLMTKWAGWVLVLTLLVVPAAPSYARGGFGGHGGFHHGGFHHGFRGGVFIGGPWWWDPWWWGPPYAYPYPYWYYPPYGPSAPASAEGSSVYIQKPSASSEQPQGYWYYCASATAYYPYVQTCPEAWIKVPPAPR